MTALRRFYWMLVRFLLSLRYRVKVDFSGDVQNIPGPVLVLPNHPGYVDPAIVMSHLRMAKTIRPLVFTEMFRNPLLRPFMRIVNALEVPDLRAHSRDSHDQARGLIDLVANRIHAGDSFIIYPSGRLQREGREVIGGARMAYDILARCPHLSVVLVRTRGVWGSRFSCAGSTGPPPLTKNSVIAAGWMLANLFVFLPLRKVQIRIELTNRDLFPLSDKAAFNAFLEKWYNSDGDELPTFVPYHPFLGARNRDYSTQSSAITFDPSAIKPSTWQVVTDLVAERIGRDLSDEERTYSTSLDDLGMDSLDRMDVALHIEHQFGFRSSQVAGTLGELAALAEGVLAGESPPLQINPSWFLPPTKARHTTVVGETLPKAFFHRVQQNPSDAALADQISGVLTYRQVLVGAYLLSKKCRPLEGKAVGILLPASVAADLSFLALQLADKLPVMLNWTTGPTNLGHAIKTLDVKHVLTSRRFLDRLGIELPGANPIFIEDLRKSMGKWKSIATFLMSYVAPHRMTRYVHDMASDQPAVILFTSGSENLPKAVPLTHANLLANIRAGIKAIDFRRGDALLGFLPPFHSFGLTANLLMPLLTGTRVVHHPDPTDARGLSKIISSFRPTLLFATPTFLNYIVQVSEPRDLASLRMIMTGAEKCPDTLRDLCTQRIPAAVMLEGYGITECSPVVSVNRADRLKPGTIGIPLEGVVHLIVDPDSHNFLPLNSVGLLLVRGPTIFSGYLNYVGPDPFINVDGHRWYNTGDLVSEDADGFIHFRGRLKRFLKAGGEMISLPALEEPFQNLYPPDESGPRVAVEGIETPDGRHIVLFHRDLSLSLRDANAHLVQVGLRGVMRLDEVRTLDRIPVLGTGKTDYKSLRKIVESLLA
ncbi:MAG: AMP-binding protein [Planctomycetota bacterium]|nr:AMP-binding protein [Planctomycetota bacterium]